MKKFVLMHFGFEPPTPEIMDAWKAWFASLGDRMVEQIGLMNGREISRDGARDLAMDLDAITGYNVIHAEDLAEAEALAQSNPFISSIRIYEVR